MYDPKGEPREFVGASREEAVGKACEFFGTRAEELTVVEVPPGRVSGVAARALLVAFPKGMTPRPVERRERRDRGERSERGERDRGRRRSEGPGRRPRADEPAPGAAASVQPAGAGPPAEPSVGHPLTSLTEVGEFVRGVVERMGLGPFEVGETDEGRNRVVQLRGAAARELGAGDGRAVEALQLLVNQVAMSKGPEEPRVILDVEGEGEKRAALLERVAERAARRAASSGRAVALDPMNGRDRRTIHLALRDTQGIATMSVGEGRYRQVVVVPEGAPEYEEALRHEEEAASREGEG